MDPEGQIREIVDRETRAWDTADVPLLLSIFHRDFVWPSPRDAHGHDPIDWVMPLGKFDEARWSSVYSELFASNELRHNRRLTRKITVSAQGDAALAIVDVDTLWIDVVSGDEDHWLGRAGKVYSLGPDGWKLTMHSGLLDYGELGESPVARISTV